MTKVFIAGHKGMVGSALLRRLRAAPGVELITRSREELDLLDQVAVREFFLQEKPDQVYLAAAKVGGIYANNMFPADFVYQNLVIQTNVIGAAFSVGVEKLLFLGSSCIYPRLASQPIAETELLTGPLEPTNEPYAIAKIAGIKLCESYRRQYGVDYRCVMPTNLYGQGDNFHEENSHVIPAMMRRFHLAKVADDAEAVVWGSGKPKREFLHVEDMADACVHVMSVPSRLFAATTEGVSHLNIGSGCDYSIADLARIIAKVVGFRGKLVFDSSKPDGAPRKLLDVALLEKIGWQASVDLEAGLRDTYDWFNRHQTQLRGIA